MMFDVANYEFVPVRIPLTSFNVEVPQCHVPRPNRDT
jgi:hypothetical protein